MGYGGVFKTVVRIAVTALGASVGGPIGAAVASAAVTGATGGSFKDALISGATSFVGTSIGQSLSQGITNAATTVPVDDLTSAIGVAGAPTDAIASAAGSLVNTPASDIPLVGDVITAVQGGVSKFGATAPDLFQSGQSAFDAFQEMGAKTLGSLGIDVSGIATPVAVNTAADVVGTAAGGLAGWTLEQALTAEVPGLDDALLKGGFTPTAIAALRQEARNAMAQRRFDEILGATPKVPGLSDEEFNKIIASGVEKLNTSLGPTTTEEAFNAKFNRAPQELGQTFLTEERDLRRKAYTDQIGKAVPKPTELFQPSLTDDAIDRILGQQRAGVEQGIATAEARGNLNPLGGKTARQFLDDTSQEARQKLGDIGGVVRQDAVRGVEDILGRATQKAQTYELGQPAFDVAPVKTEVESFVTQRTEPGFVEQSIRDILGSQQLFDLRKTVNEGGRSQGLVAGPPKNTLLDEIAARQGALDTRNRRGLGVRGSGVF